MRRPDLFEKTLMLGKIEWDELVGWHHRLNGHESEQALRVGEEQRSRVCCSPQGGKGSDTTERLN